MIIGALNPAFTACSQWFEHTLDDSANKRICIPDAFFAVDAILSLYLYIVRGMRVNTYIIEKHLLSELPFMAMENILMHCVKKGGDRQELHAAMHQHAKNAANKIKQCNSENDLLKSIINDTRFNIDESELSYILIPEHYTGCAEQQTENFLSNEIKIILEKNQSLLDMEIEIKI